MPCQSAQSVVWVVGFRLQHGQILSLVGQGLANPDIADRLGVGAKTVDNQRTNLMRKAGAHSVAELLAYAVREGPLDVNRET